MSEKNKAIIERDRVIRNYNILLEKIEYNLNQIIKEIKEFKK